jgi:hypothetical protein
MKYRNPVKGDASQLQGTMNKACELSNVLWRLTPKQQ